ncbi:hypothetical protein GGR50DRAFT_610073 [Xylaria sp. CBS 124048]|nr:hypothetical protein GGR50DRAFT_610073 [Xylaria sp. CBS 124048]
MAPRKTKSPSTSTKTSERKVTRRAIEKISSKANQKRGQPTAAGRLISSPYIKYGWHKPLAGEIKEIVQNVSSAADSMYMVQMQSKRAIDSLSLRNGIFWEHRQLMDPRIVSTPAIDHIDLFSSDDELFWETQRKINREYLSGGEVRIHYLFEGIRGREFLILPVDVDGYWVTLIARTEENDQKDDYGSIDEYADKCVTDFAVVDPEPKGRLTRRNLIENRLTAILPEGCVELTEMGAVYHDLTVPDLDSSSSSSLGSEGSDRWKTGLIAYAVAREFLRRLKVLQYRRSKASTKANRTQSQNASEADTDTDAENIDIDMEFLWAPFEETYNFENYREHLMSACAHQCIEKSNYQIRLGLEVPSEDSGYFPGITQPVNSHELYPDEKWDSFQAPTHTLSVLVPAAARQTGPETPFRTPDYGVPSPGYAPDARASPPCSPTSTPTCSGDEMEMEMEMPAGADIPGDQGSDTETPFTAAGDNHQIIDAPPAEYDNDDDDDNDGDDQSIPAVIQANVYPSSADWTETVGPQGPVLPASTPSPMTDRFELRGHGNNAPLAHMGSPGLGGFTGGRIPGLGLVSSVQSAASLRFTGSSGVSSLGMPPLASSLRGMSGEGSAQKRRLEEEVEDIYSSEGECECNLERAPPKKQKK